MHGGIGFTWEHDAHLYMRRATAIAAVLDADAAAAEVDRPHPRRGAPRAAAVDLPPEAEAIRADGAGVRRELKALDDDAAASRS